MPYHSPADDCRARDTFRWLLTLAVPAGILGLATAALVIASLR